MMDFHGTYRVQTVPNLCSYGPMSCNFIMYKYLFHDKNNFLQ